MYKDYASNFENANDTCGKIRENSTVNNALEVFILLLFLSYLLLTESFLHRIAKTDVSN